MTILTRQERERLVIELYNQGKTYREISKEARISPRDIGVILNKVIEEKKTEGKEVKHDDFEQNQQQLSLSTQAYKLFSEGKTPLEVAIALNLRETEATKFCREYWKLKQLHNLNLVYEEIKDDIASFLKLYKLAKDKGIGVRQVIDVLTIANNDLRAIEERLKRLRNDVSMLQSQKHTCKRTLYKLNNQIATTTKLLNTFRISCERERREIENLYNEKTRLESIVTEFKSNNEEYLEIKQVAQDKIKSVLTNGKILLRFATASVIESLRRNPDKYNDLLVYNAPLSGLLLHSEGYRDMIVEEANSLYGRLLKHFTDNAMDNAAFKMMSIPPRLSSQSNESDIYRIEQSEIYHNNKDDNAD